MNTTKEDLIKETNGDIKEEIQEKIDTDKVQENKEKINTDEVQINKEKINKDVVQEKPKKQNKIIKAIKITIKTICFAVLIIAIVFMIRALAYKKYDVCGYRFYMIMSGSMEPTIHVGDAVITKPISEPQEGDIIAFDVNNSITVHRIVRVNTERDIKLYQTKGDNNNAEDKNLLKEEQIVGEVAVIIPKAGDAMLFLQRNFIIVIIFIIGIAIIIALARRLYNENKR